MMRRDDEDDDLFEKCSQLLPQSFARRELISEGHISLKSVGYRRGLFSCTRMEETRINLLAIMIYLLFY